jgi:hypothetical protein
MTDLVDFGLAVVGIAFVAIGVGLLPAALD